MRELSAAEITNDALLMLRAHGARVRRANNVAVRRRSNTVEKGWPDIQGYSSQGVVILCEVKKIGDTLTNEQKERLLDCQKCGGLAFVAVQIHSSTQVLSIADYLVRHL